MTHHFLQHYFQRVGVWPTHSTFVVQHPGNHSLLVETLGELSRAGVRTSNVVVRIERFADQFWAGSSFIFLARPLLIQMPCMGPGYVGQG